MNTAPPTKSYIYYNPERVDYSLNEEELNSLKNAGQNHWRDVTLVSVAICLPCIINALSEIAQQETFNATLSIILNFIIGGIGLGFTIIFGILWAKTKNRATDIIEKLKKKPKIEAPTIPAASNVGEIQGT